MSNSLWQPSITRRVVNPNTPHNQVCKIHCLLPAIKVIKHKMVNINSCPTMQRIDYKQVFGIPPPASRSIFSMDLGPNVVRMMSATACEENIVEQ
jgi:hypothetical protein